MKTCIQKIVKDNTRGEDDWKDVWRPTWGERKAEHNPKDAFENLSFKNFILVVLKIHLKMQ